MPFDLYEKMESLRGGSVAEKIVAAIMYDATDRRGIKHEILGCDPDIQEEIVNTWVKLAEKELTELR